MVDDVQFSSEIASNDAINAKDFQPYTPAPTTTTTTTTIAAVNVSEEDGSPDDPQDPTTTTNNITTITTTADNTTSTSNVTKVDGSVGQNCGENIHEKEYCESVDLSETFDGTLKSPGVTTILHSVKYEEAKDFNSSESEKCFPIGNMTTIINTHLYNLMSYIHTFLHRQVHNSIHSDSNPHILQIY